MSARAELIEKVEKATGSDRKIDAAVARALATKDVTDHWFYSGGKWVTDATVPPVSESLDAVVALVEKKLPIGEGPGCWHWYVDDRSAAVWPDGIYDESAVQAATPALALLLAFLRSIGEE